MGAAVRPPLLAGGADSQRAGRRRFLVTALALPFGVSAQSRLPDVVRANKPAIVAVGLFNATANPRFAFRGTGFVVDDGLTIISNAHVMPSLAELNAFGNQLQVRLPGTGGQLEARTATITGADADRDLVVLRIDGAPMPTLKLAPPDYVAEGTAVAFMGFPIGGMLGFSIVTHRAMISALTAAAIPSPTASRLTARAAAGLRDGTFQIYQLDGTAYPGNSGGPVFDVETGQVVAVINMVLVKGTREAALSAPTGISYAIPVRHVHALLARR
jgi:S1-C subfamily serine protease